MNLKTSDTLSRSHLLFFVFVFSNPLIFHLKQRKPYKRITKTINQSLSVINSFETLRVDKEEISRELTVSFCAFTEEEDEQLSYQQHSMRREERETTQKQRQIYQELCVS